MQNFSIRLNTMMYARAGQNAAVTPGMMNPPGLAVTGPDQIDVALAAAPASVAPITGYDLRYSTDGATWSQIDSVVSPVSLTALTADTLYFVQTRAESANGLGPWSLSNTARTDTALGNGATLPAAFGPGDWTVSDLGTGSDVLVRVLALPADGGAALEAIEYQINGGGWIPLGVAATGEFQFTWLASGSEISVALRATNANGPGPASASKAVTPSFSPVALSGATLPQQDLLRGVEISPIDTSILFIGGVDTIQVAPNSPETLPPGLSLSVEGVITGTPLEASTLTQLAIVQLEATGPTGTVIYTDGITFSVTGPALEALSVDGSTVALSSDTGDGVVHLWFGTGSSPDEAEIIGGTGTGFLEQRDFAISGAGGATTEWDLSTYEGVSGFLFALQVAANGAYSNRLFLELTPFVPDMVPDAFADTDWSVTDAETGGAAVVSIAALSADGGTPITSVEFQIDGGSWSTLTGTAAPGTYEILGLTDGVAVDIALRAINAVGAGPASPAKTVTPTRDMPELSGTLIPQQNLLRGVEITPLDTSILFTGSTDPVIDIDPNSPETLPPGLTISPEGMVTGTPSEASTLTQLANVQIRATGAAGSVTYTTGIVFSVTGPALEALSINVDTISLSSDTGEGTVHLWFGTNPSPEDIDIINGTGAGFLEEQDFAVTSAGGATTEWDLSAYRGVNGFLYALQVAASGAYSNRLFMELTPIVPVPAGFGPGDWSVAARRESGVIVIAIHALPDEGTQPTTALEYQIDGGLWVEMTTTPATGIYDITGLTDDVAISVAIRAVNPLGAGPASTPAVVTPTATRPHMLSNYAEDLAVDPMAISFDASADVAGKTVYIEAHDDPTTYPGRGFGAHGSHAIGPLTPGANLVSEVGMLGAYAGRDIVLFVTAGDEWASNALVGQVFSVPGTPESLADPDGNPFEDPDGTPLEE